MPRNTREWAIRKMRYANHGLDGVAQHVMEVIELYDQPHPEVSEPLKAAIEMMKLIAPIFSKIERSL